MRIRYLSCTKSVHKKYGSKIDPAHSLRIWNDLLCEKIVCFPWNIMEIPKHNDREVGKCEHSVDEEHSWMQTPITGLPKLLLKHDSCRNCCEMVILRYGLRVRLRISCILYWLLRRLVLHILALSKRVPTLNAEEVQKGTDENEAEDRKAQKPRPWGRPNQHH